MRFLGNHVRSIWIYRHHQASSRLHESISIRLKLSTTMEIDLLRDMVSMPVISVPYHRFDNSYTDYSTTPLITYCPNHWKVTATGPGIWDTICAGFGTAATYHTVLPPYARRPSICYMRQSAQAIGIRVRKLTWNTLGVLPAAQLSTESVTAHGPLLVEIVKPSSVFSSISIANKREGPRDSRGNLPSGIAVILAHIPAYQVPAVMRQPLWIPL